MKAEIWKFEWFWIEMHFANNIRATIHFHSCNCIHLVFEYMQSRLTIKVRVVSLSTRYIDLTVRLKCNMKTADFSWLISRQSAWKLSRKTCGSCRTYRTISVESQVKYKNNDNNNNQTVSSVRTTYPSLSNAVKHASMSNSVSSSTKFSPSISEYCGAFRNFVIFI